MIGLTIKIGTKMILVGIVLRKYEEPGAQSEEAPSVSMIIDLLRKIEKELGIREDAPTAVVMTEDVNVAKALLDGWGQP